MIDFEELIIFNKSEIPRVKDEIIRYEEALGGRGESSIIRYY